MFLWIVVIVMALALLGAMLALVGMTVVAVGALRQAVLLKREVTEKLQPSISMFRELAPLLRPKMVVIKTESREILSFISRHLRAAHAIWQDASVRAQRFRVRLQREGGATVQQLQRDKRVVKHGVVQPMRRISSVALGVRSAAWLLRKVA